MSSGSLGWFGAGYGAAIDSTIHPYYSLYKRLPKQGEPFHDKISTKLQKAMELIQTIMEEEKDLRTEQKSKFIFHVDHIASVEPLLQVRVLECVLPRAVLTSGIGDHQSVCSDIYRRVFSKGKRGPFQNCKSRPRSSRDSSPELAKRPKDLSSAYLHPSRRLGDHSMAYECCHQSCGSDVESLRNG